MSLLKGVSTFPSSNRAKDQSAGWGWLRNFWIPVIEAFLPVADMGARMMSTHVVGRAVSDAGCVA